MREKISYFIVSYGLVFEDIFHDNRQIPDSVKKWNALNVHTGFLMLNEVILVLEIFKI